MSKNINAKKLSKLKDNKRVCEQVRKECKWKLPMCKMTYPEAIITNEYNVIQYRSTIKQCEETINNINKIILQYNHNNINREVNKSIHTLKGMVL
jgi:hypothetical protein